MYRYTITNQHTGNRYTASHKLIIFVYEGCMRFAYKSASLPVFRYVCAVNLKNPYTPKKMRLYTRMCVTGYTFAYTDLDVLCHLYTCIRVYIFNPFYEKIQYIELNFFLFYIIHILDMLW